MTIEELIKRISAHVDHEADSDWKFGKNYGIIMALSEVKKYREEIEGGMRVIVKEPSDPVGYYKRISNNLEALQREVGGYIEVVTVCSDVAIICNEEGRLIGLPRNCTIGGIDFVGTILVVGVDGDEFCDCPMTLVDWERHWV